MKDMIALVILSKPKRLRN